MTAVRAIRRWFDTSNASVDDSRVDDIDWLRVVPFVALHLSCFAVIWVGVSPAAVVACVVAYAVRMFAITAFYHRYFSHRAFKTSRVWQFVFAWLGATAAQRGPIWWAAHHRHHHAHSDDHEDAHSPKQRGFWRAHIGWFLTRGGFAPDLSRVRDLQHFPELRWLDRYDVLAPVSLALFMFLLGAVLDSVAPHLGTSGGQMLVWGFVISTIACYHATYTINSLCHVFGSRRYPTRDESRNNFLLALLTFGEGWHNNHHFYPKAARQGFFWWEIDLTYYGLKLLEALHVIRDVKPVPADILKVRS